MSNILGLNDIINIFTVIVIVNVTMSCCVNVTHILKFSFTRFSIIIFSIIVAYCLIITLVISANLSENFVLVLRFKILKLPGHFVFDYWNC